MWIWKPALGVRNHSSLTVSAVNATAGIRCGGATPSASHVADRQRPGAHTEDPARKIRSMFYALAFIPQDVAKSAAFNSLCHCCLIAYYDVTFEEEAEKHADDCLYVKWRDLIGDPLERILDEED
jgi:hypothetical protein